MKLAKEIEIPVNYTIRKVDEIMLGLMLLETGRCRNISDALREGKIRPAVKHMIPEMLKTYDGRLKDRIKTRKGHNIVPSVVRNAFASKIAGYVVSPTFEAQYFALGDDNTVATNDDTQLVNEVVRGGFDNKYAVDNVAYLDKFFSSTEVGGNTYLEAGIFVDGSGSANTGFLLSRIVINEIMAATETLTINCTITIS